jgi:hypothetical protein
MAQAAPQASMDSSQGFLGTPDYASSFALGRLCQQSPRCDLESLGYCLLFLWNGSLPWDLTSPDALPSCSRQPAAQRQLDAQQEKPEPEPERQTPGGRDSIAAASGAAAADSAALQPSLAAPLPAERPPAAAARTAAAGDHSFTTGVPHLPRPAPSPTAASLDADASIPASQQQPPCSTSRHRYWPEAQLQAMLRERNRCWAAAVRRGHVPQHLVDWITYTNTLGWNQAPNYTYLQQLLNGLLVPQQQQPSRAASKRSALGSTSRSGGSCGAGSARKRAA